MNSNHLLQIAADLGLKETQIKSTAELLEAGGTVPFIARYRKESTGSLDEVEIAAIRDGLARLAELESRKSAVLKSLEQNGHLTDDLREKVESASTLAILEDIYLPFKPKRKTRASAAREKGLEPLALLLLEQRGSDPYALAAPFVDPEKGVGSADEALAGGRDIIAETVSEDAEARAAMRMLYGGKGIIRSRVAAGKETEGIKFRDYFEWEEPAASAPSHRILAMRRGEKEDILNLSIEVSEEEAIRLLDEKFVKGEGPDAAQVSLAVRDAFKRLLSRSMETESRLAMKERADREAIRVFAENLRQLLLSPPLGARRVMGIDPGFRTGCKIVCLDPQGKLLHHETVYLHLTEKKDREAAETILRLCADFEIEAVAVGNGTAGRETEAFVRALPFPKKIQVVLVSESGASIYSASEVAREEFPDLDLTVRGSVSIGRRLIDPLAELVKIDPKSIGVGQYQHDVDQAALKQGLDDVVASCVNKVGVEVNTASRELLTYVSGLGPQLARNIVAFRDENGPFRSREELRGVPRLGPKAFEQSAGFLRIRGGENPLDGSAVHPESYPIVDAMARDLGCTVTDLMKGPELRKRIDVSAYVSDTVGLPTLGDILDELSRPGRDPREELEPFSFASGVRTLEDLRPGMRLPGIVTNVTAFGAFVDIGVHQDGLVHVSELSDRFVKDPATVVKVHQKVSVFVKEVDPARRRISLSMKTAPSAETVVPKAAPDEKKRDRRPEKKEKPAPFNNPFTEAFKNRSEKK